MFKKIFIFFSFLSLFISTQVLAIQDPKFHISDPGYQALYLSQSIPDPIEIPAGSEKTVVFYFKNVGTKTWDENSLNYISAYTIEPRYHYSPFYNSSWLEPRQTPKIKGIVKPGEIGKLVLKLTAPNEVGDYVEQFHLASDAHSWVKGGWFYVKIKVVPSTVEEKEEINNEKQNFEQTEENEEQINSKNNRTKRIGLNKKTVKIVGGKKIKLIVLYQNISDSIWTDYAIVNKSDNQEFQTSKWVDDEIILEKKAINIKPFQTIRQTFYIQAPAKKGDYEFNFGLKVNDEFLPESLTKVKITVTKDGVIKKVKGLKITKKQTKPRLKYEPSIRVGIWRDPETKVEFISNDDDYIVSAGYKEKGILPKNQLAELNYKDGYFSFKTKNLEFKTTQFIYLKPKNNKHAVYTLVNFDRYIKWKGHVNFNKYRGELEYRLTSDKKNKYIINILPFEDYIKGIAETSNIAPKEYIKALLTAARTYAYYIKKYTNKHDNRHFDVVAHTGDQLYLGYNSEKLMPRVAQAAEETRGYMVTYDLDHKKSTPNQVVITPYFANSNGRTKSWSDVWGGNKPWLISVKADYDQGRTQHGHGVGMSALDAAIRAEKEHLSWRDLLKYYYTGIEIEKIYP